MKREGNHLHRGRNTARKGEHPVQPNSARVASEPARREELDGDGPELTHQRQANDPMRGVAPCPHRSEVGRRNRPGSLIFVFARRLRTFARTAAIRILGAFDQGTIRRRIAISSVTVRMDRKRNPNEQSKTDQPQIHMPHYSAAPSLGNA